MDFVPNEQFAARSCGECTACCTALTIPDPELRKPAGVPCVYLSPAGGCGIYERRPQVCKSFLCGWRLYPLPEELRPDRAGVLIRPQPGAGAGLTIGLVSEDERPLFSEAVMTLVGAWISNDAPVAISVRTRPGYCSAQVNLNAGFAAAVAARDLAAARACMRVAIDTGHAATTDPEPKL